MMRLYGFARRNNIMAQTVVDAALWVSAEAMPAAMGSTPMDSMDFSPPVHAFPHSPELAHVHCNMHAVLLHRDGSNLGNIEESLLACSFFREDKGGNERQSERLQQSHHQQQCQPHHQQQWQQQQQQQEQQQQQQRQHRQQQQQPGYGTKRTHPYALIPSSHIAMRVQRLRGGGPNDDDSDGNGSDEECTPDARRVVAADPGTPVRSSKRHLTSELATASEETEEWRAFEEAEREARRWRTERRVAEQRARWEAAKQGTSGERTAAREAARSEAGRAAQRCTDKARSKRRRKAARALERGAAEAAGSGATAGEQ